jgi:hypothetical protein
MDFKIVPFTAQVSRDSNAASVADQIQSVVDVYNSQGWEYLRMESVQTWVAGSSGCFGIGAQPGFNTIFNVLVFRKL